MLAAVGTSFNMQTCNSGNSVHGKLPLLKSVCCVFKQDNMLVTSARYSITLCVCTQHT